LRLSRPPVSGKDLRCPRCAGRFAPPTSLAVAASPASFAAGGDSPATAPPRSRTLVLAVAAICLTVLLTGAGIAAMVVMLRHPPEPPPTPPAPPTTAVKEDTDKSANAAYDRLMLRGESQMDKKEYAAAANSFEAAGQVLVGDTKAAQRLHDAQTALEEVKKGQEKFAHALDDAQAALSREQYADAKKLYESALEISPDEPKALTGLRRAKDGLREQEEQANRKAEYDRLLALGKAKMDAGEYAAAISTFEVAVKVLPGDGKASEALLEARAALSKDESKKTKQQKYQLAMDDARKDLQAKQFQRARLGFMAALAEIPNDPLALQGKADAEKGLNAQVAANPPKPDPKQPVNPAPPVDPVRDADPRDVLRDYRRWMAQGYAAREARRWADAVVAFNEALKLVPDDIDAALRLEQAQVRLREVEELTAVVTAALAQQQWAAAREAIEKLRRVTRDPLLLEDQFRTATYQLNLAEGKAATQARRWADALRFYRAALAENPSDPNLPYLIREAETQLRIQNNPKPAPDPGPKPPPKPDPPPKPGPKPTPDPTKPGPKPTPPTTPSK
jgi:tetratricopeptide (TPR) repeat protein